MKKESKIIVLGVGNVLMCDEGAGVRAAEKIMNEYTFPPNIEIYDAGTTGMHGLLPLMEEADHLIILDAVNGPGEPGTIFRYTLDDFKLTIPKKISVHDVGLIECLALCEVNGRMPESVVIIGIKPADISRNSMELSDKVKSKMDELVKMAVAELKRLY